MKYLKPYLVHLDERTLERVNSFCIAGCLGLIISWMKNNFDDTPESLAKISYTLVLSALKPYMTKNRRVTPGDFFAVANCISFLYSA